MNINSFYIVSVNLLILINKAKYKTIHRLDTT